MTTVMCCSPSGLKETRLVLGKPGISCVANDGVLGWKFMGKISRRKQEVLYTQSMTNAPELLSRLREVGRCMALPARAANEVRTACRTLAQTTEAESAEIAAAGLGLAEAAEADPVTRRGSGQRPRRGQPGRREVSRPCSGAALVTGIPASLVRSGGRAVGVQQPRLRAGLAAASGTVRTRRDRPGIALSRPVDRPGTRGTALPVPGRSQAGPCAQYSRSLD